MSFEFASAGLDLDRLAATIQIQGIDNAPWPGRVQKNESTLTVLRQSSDSGRMSLSWPTTHGWLRIATGSLPERDVAYKGELELARGFINDVRNHIAIWVEAGLSIPENLNNQIKSATELFIDAELATDRIESARLASESIDNVIATIYELTESFANQVAEIQKQYRRKLEFSFGIAGNNRADFPLNCDCLDWIAFCPTKIESGFIKECDELGKSGRIIVGPFVDVSPDGLKQLELSELEFDAQRTAFISRLTQLQEIKQLDYEICHVIGGIDGIGHRQMSFPHQLQLAMDAIHHAQLNTEKPLMVSFCNPFGDQVARSLGGSFAIQIADEMLRRGAQISVLGLEVNLDFLPQGDVTCQPFAWLDMLDQWAYFGIPLIILLRAPSVEIPQHDASEAGWRRQPIWNSMTVEQRTKYLKVLLSLVGTRLGVQALIWNNRFTLPGAKYSVARINEAHCSNEDLSHVYPLATGKFKTVFDQTKA